MYEKAVGMDIAKNVFHIFTMAGEGKPKKKRLRRKQVLGYFANHEKVLIGIEACASAHYWARELVKLGHEVKLLNAGYVKALASRLSRDIY